MKNRTVAAFMALFGGLFGIHKFYLNQPGPGIMYLVLFFMFSRFIPVTIFLGVFDALRLFMMTDREFDRKYNGGRQSRRDDRNRGRNDSRQRRTPVSNKTRQRANPFKKSGIRKYKEYDLDEAIIDFNKGLEIEPDDVALHFNIACAYSLTEQKDLAYTHLSRAVELGFKDFDKIQSHDDLAFLRIQPDFEEFKTAGFKIGGASRSESNDQSAEVKDDRLLAQLNKLKELREKGIISEADYSLETKKILRR